MRRWQMMASIVPLLFLFGEAQADDKEDVLARMASFYSALNAGDADAFGLASYTQYNVEGGLIRTRDPARIKAWLTDAFASGLKIDVRTFHENADVYGNTAVFTCYERVRVNPPEGEPINDTRRVTVVLVKQKGEWEAAHVHLSYLTPVNPE